MFAHPSLTQLAADLSNGRLPLLTYLDQLEAYFDQREPEVLAFVPENGRFARLRREAQAMARLSHPNVVTVHDVGEEEGQIFVAMEYVRGVTLRAWLGAQARSWQEILEVFVPIGRGLAAAHAAGIVHRDFKP